MKKAILIASLAVFVMALGYIVISRENGEAAKLEGVITNVHNGCWSDGVCAIEVNGKWWIVVIKGGLRLPNNKSETRGEAVGIVFNKANENVGKKVEVYAKKTGKNSLTIFGSKKYYIKVINK